MKIIDKIKWNIKKFRLLMKGTTLEIPKLNYVEIHKKVKSVHVIFIYEAKFKEDRYLDKVKFQFAGFIYKRGFEPILVNKKDSIKVEIDLEIHGTIKRRSDGRKIPSNKIHIGKPKIKETI